MCELVRPDYLMIHICCKAYFHNWFIFPSFIGLSWRSPTGKLGNYFIDCFMAWYLKFQWEGCLKGTEWKNQGDFCFGIEDIWLRNRHLHSQFLNYSLFFLYYYKILTCWKVLNFPPSKIILFHYHHLIYISFLSHLFSPFIYFYYLSPN